MAKTVQDTIKEPIEIVDCPEEISESSALSKWLLIVPGALAIVAGIFFVVSRFLSKDV